MADKIWTAADVKLGPLKITPRNDKAKTMHIERRYGFIDAEGNVLAQVAGGRVVADIPFAELPASIRAALQDIDAWTKSQALEQEGMNE